MPSINIYTTEKHTQELKLIINELKDFISNKLSCKDRTINSNEIKKTMCHHTLKGVV